MLITNDTRLTISAWTPLSYIYGGERGECRNSSISIAKIGGFSLKARFNVDKSPDMTKWDGSYHLSKISKPGVS